MRFKVLSDALRNAAYKSVCMLKGTSNSTKKKLTHRKEISFIVKSVKIILKESVCILKK